jgi:hypothetical protein
MELCDLPRDVLKIIISYCPYGQWFQLSKELSTLASQVISPLKCRISEKGALYWALSNKKIVAAISLLKDPRNDPSVENNFAIRHASKCGYKEVVEMLLKDSRVDPYAAYRDYAMPLLVCVLILTYASIRYLK